MSHYPRTHGAARAAPSGPVPQASVVTTVLGVSARAMLKALIAGEQAPEQLADLAQRRLRRKRAALGEALTGRVTAHHRFLLDHLLRHIEFLDGAIAACARQVET